MAFKFVVFACVLAYVNAQIYHDEHGATSYSSINLAQPQLKLAAAPLVKYQAPLVKYQAPLVQYHQAPLAVAHAPLLKKVIVEEDAPAHYEFAYAVNDPHTGDIKEQKEQREGDVVKGMYSLVEPDGSKRIVEYTADKHNGFNAVVHREAGKHPVQIKAVPVVKTIAAAPVYKYTAPVVKYAAPAVHAAPLLKAAPIAHFSAAPSVSYATFNTPHFQIHH